jgi:hypothetical protein
MSIVAVVKTAYPLPLLKACYSDCIKVSANDTTTY